MVRRGDGSSTRDLHVGCGIAQLGMGSFNRTILDLRASKTLSLPMLFSPLQLRAHCIPPCSHPPNGTSDQASGPGKAEAAGMERSCRQRFLASSVALLNYYLDFIWKFWLCSFLLQLWGGSGQHLCPADLQHPYVLTETNSDSCKRVLPGGFAAHQGGDLFSRLATNSTD